MSNYILRYSVDMIRPDGKYPCPYDNLEQLRKDNSIARIGAQADEKVKEVFSPRAIAERISAEINQKLDALRKHMQQLQQDEDVFRKRVERLDAARRTIDDWHGLQEKTKAIEKDGGFITLEAHVAEKRSLCETYALALGAVLPKFLSIIKDTARIYEQIMSCRGKTRSMSLLLGSQKERLEKIRQEIGRVLSEKERLRSGWINRYMNKGRIVSLEEKEMVLRRDEVALSNECQSTESTLVTLNEREADLMGELHTVLSLLNEMTEETKKIVGFVLTHCQDMLILASDMPTNGLFEKDRDILSAFLDNEPIQNLHMLFTLVWEQSTRRSDPVQEYLQKELLNAERHLSAALKIKNAVLNLKSQFDEAFSFFQENEEQESNLRQRLQQLYKEINRDRGQISELENRLEKLEDDIIVNARLLAMTMVRASYDQQFANMRFDVLVVDEFSMISLPQLYCVASLISDRVILCGDHLQLPPIAQSRTEKARKWLGRSFYEWHEGTYKERQNRGPIKLGAFLTKLGVQYRMPESISTLVKPWYRREGNNLTDKWEKREWEDLRAVPHDLLRHHIVILDSTDTNAYHSRSSTGSYYNLIHAGIAGEVCRELIGDYRVASNKVLYIAPYHDQAALTRVLVSYLCPKNNIEDTLPLVTTVHKSQGKGFPIVIYDLTDGVQKGLTGFHKQLEPNILNVALTRSEAHLILLCSFVKMRKALEEYAGSPLSDVFKCLMQNGTPIVNAKSYADRVFQRVNLSDLLDDSSVKLTEQQRNSVLVLNSATYYHVLEDDLEKARESLLIVSPFITRSRTDRLIPIIEKLHVIRGDKIRIELITRPPDRMFDRFKDPSWSGAAVKKVLNRLVSLGVTVTLSPDTHGKLVVIDNKINYWGSLNPLSYRDTCEINTRLEADGLSKELIKIARSGQSWPYKPTESGSFSEEDITNDYRIIAQRELNNLRYVLAKLYKRHRVQLMWRKTINSLITNPPSSWDDYFELPEFKRRRCVLMNHLEQIEDIIYPIRGKRLPPYCDQKGQEPLLNLLAKPESCPPNTPENEKNLQRLGAALEWAKKRKAEQTKSLPSKSRRHSNHRIKDKEKPGET